MVIKCYSSRKIKNLKKKEKLKSRTFHIPQHLQTFSKFYSKVAASNATLLA